MTAMEWLRQEEQELLCHLRDEGDIAMKRSNTILPSEPCSQCGKATTKACVTCRDTHCDECNAHLNDKYTNEGDGCCFECREDTGTLIEDTLMEEE